MRGIRRAGLCACFAILLPALALPGAIEIEGNLDEDCDMACRQAVTQAAMRLTTVFPWLAVRVPSYSFYRNGAPGSPASAFSAGYYRARDHRVLVQHVPLLVSQGRLTWTVFHETVHAALALAGPGRIPVWLEEGSAIFFSEQELLEPEPGQSGARSIAELEARIRGLSARSDEAAWRALRRYHAQARDVVRNLVNRGDRERFVAFLRTLKNGTPFGQALQSWYELTSADLAAWL